MFNSATSFNQNIANWNISNITDMSNMFNGATSFNKDLSSWGVDQVTVCDSFASGATAWTKAHPNFSSCTP